MIKSESRESTTQRKKCMDMHYATLVYIYTYIQNIFISRNLDKEALIALLLLLYIKKKGENITSFAFMGSAAQAVAHQICIVQLTMLCVITISEC